MTRSALGIATLILGFGFALGASGAALARGGSLSCPPSLFDAQGKGRHALFSAVSLSRSAFAKKWNASRTEFSKSFPLLSFEPGSNLHITLVYIGKGWDPTRIEDLDAGGLADVPSDYLPLSLRATPVIFGRNDNLIALRLETSPQSWAEAVIKGREALTRLGLRKWDEFDSAFVPHVTLARMRSNTPESKAQLGAFFELLRERMISSPEDFPITQSDRARYFLSLPPHQVGNPMSYRELLALCKMSI